ncbi:MAG: phage tail assembly protein [Xanthobacteraceae bacterium]|nr:phage tail assembly protein [Xanthobacteraceae bacterium]
MADANTVTLSRPLKTHRGDVSEITLKEPTAASFLRAKADPYRLRFYDDKVEYIFDPVACMSFLCDMTGFDSLVLEALPAHDFKELCYVMVRVIRDGLGGEKNPPQP